MELFCSSTQKQKMNSVLLSCSDIIRTSINVIVQFPKYEINIVSFCSYINYVQSVFDHIKSGKPFCTFTYLSMEHSCACFFFITIIFFTLKVVNQNTSICNFTNCLFVIHNLACTFISILTFMDTNHTSFYTRA